MADTEAIRGLLQDGDKVIIPYVNPATKTNEGIVKVDDALSSTSENPVQNKVINTALGGKQATLVSGTNIKTVNNTSLLGNGNIAVQSVINDLSDIRSNATAGKNASDTISGYGDIVTHDADEFMPADTVIPVVNNATLTIQKNGSTVDTFTANASADKIINITVPTKASDVSALPSSTKYGASLSMSINSTTYVLTAQMKDQDGNNLGTAQTIDLPIESLVMDVDFDSDTNELVIELQSGTITRVPIGSIIGGLQSEINANNKLDADFIEDTLTTKKLVTTAEKNTWNGKQDALTAGDNISISGGTISATDTIYKAGTNITISGGTISATDTTYVAGSGIAINGNTISNTQTSAVWGNVTGTLSNQTDLQTALDGKDDIPSIELYNGTSGNPKPIKFVSVDYNNANSENGIFIQITMQSSHGNGQSYAFFQDAFININYEGNISCEVFKYFGATTTYNSTSRQYGDIFWVHDSVNKVVDFYTLMGQFSALYYTPYRRLNLSTGGVITQYTSATAYLDGTQVWATCGDYYTTADPVLTNLTENATSLTIKGTPISSACGNSINIGYGSSVGDNGEVCVGVGASTRQIASTAIGFYASASKTNAIQIGTGTNPTANTFCVGFRNVDNYLLLDGSTGYIPNARINMDTTVTASSTNAVTSGAVSTAIANMQTTGNLVTSVSSASTDAQYPSAKLFYDTCGDIETLINAL